MGVRFTESFCCVLVYFQKMFETFIFCSSGTSDENDLKVVADLLNKFNLNNGSLNTEGKLNALALIFHEAIAESAK